MKTLKKAFSLFLVLASVNLIGQNPVQWTNKTGVTEIGSTLYKIGSNGWFPGAGATSTNSLAPNTDGYVETEVQETNTYRMIGLAAPNANPHFSTIDYAINLTAFGTIAVYHSGNNIGSFGTYNPGDIIRVERIGSQLHYMLNGATFHQLAINPADELVVDVSFFTQNATLFNTWSSFASAVSVGGGADNLGNHSATQNIAINSFWYSGDGDDEGLHVDASGKVGIGNQTPWQQLDVHGGYILSDDFSGTGRFYGGRENDDYIEVSASLSNADYMSFNVDGEVGRFVNQNFGVGTVNPLAKIHSDNGSVLFVGGSGSTPISGHGSRMMFVGNLSAFRAGMVNGNQWDHDSIGNYSVAAGLDPVASSTGSVAFGTRARVTGSESVAIGEGTKVSGTNSIAIGHNCEVNEDFGIAIGEESDVFADHGLAIGNGALSNAEGAIAFGHEVIADAFAAMTIGVGDTSHAGPLLNTLPMSLAVGFNSDIPTLFVGPSNGQNTTGKVGINELAPSHKLHIYADPNDDSNDVLRLDGTGPFRSGAKLNFGAFDAVYLQEDEDDALNIFSTGRTAITGGNVGIGTLNPTANLQVGDTTGINDLVIATGGSGNYATLGFHERESGVNLGFDFDYETDDNRLVLKSFNNGIYSADMAWFSDGRVAIGTTSPATGYLLSVEGKIIAEEVKIQLETNWPDYVFDEDYDLMPLEDLENSIKENGHLPGIETAELVESEGLNLGSMQTKMMEKIEELTLYILQLKKEKDQLNARVNDLENDKN